MKTLAALGIALCLAGAPAYAKHVSHFTGKLMDAGCYNTNKVASQESGHKTYKSIVKTCVPTPSTTAFAIRVDDGTTIKLDDSGNSQAAAAVQSGAFKVDQDGDMHVTAKGELAGELLHTEYIRALNGRKTTTAGTR